VKKSILKTRVSVILEMHTDFNRTYMKLFGGWYIFYYCR
jgi:hypothetical protein